jgi:hypothetical protein
MTLIDTDKLNKSFEYNGGFNWADRIYINLGYSTTKKWVVEASIDGRKEIIFTSNLSGDCEKYIDNIIAYENDKHHKEFFKVEEGYLVHCRRIKNFEVRKDISFGYYIALFENNSLSQVVERHVTKKRLLDKILELQEYLNNNYI